MVDMTRSTGRTENNKLVVAVVEGDLNENDLDNLSDCLDPDTPDDVWNAAFNELMRFHPELKMPLARSLKL